MEPVQNGFGPPENEVDVTSQCEGSVHGDIPRRRSALHIDGLGTSPRRSTDTINDTRLTLFRDLVKPSFVQETKDALRYRRYWNKAANVSDIFGKLFIVVATILAFMSFYTDDESPRKACAFSSGVLGILALTLMYFEARAKISAQENTYHISEMFKNTNQITP